MAAPVQIRPATRGATSGHGPASPGTAGDTRWSELQALASGCTRCRLHTDRHQVVFGAGPLDARLVLVGLAPGRHEELSGRPFAGAVGNLVDNLLLENGLARRDVYLCTVVKCRPPGNRVPEADEVETCATFLRAQLSQLTPEVVVTFGRTATELLLERPVPLARVAGYRFHVHGATLIPTYDPLDALRGNGRAMIGLRRDVRTAAGVLNGRVATARDAVAELRARKGAADR